MTKPTELFFVDGIENLSYTAGAFRFDLASIKPWSQKQQSKENKKQDANQVRSESETQAHIVMTPQGFIQALRAMENFLKLVEQKGIIRINEPTDTHISAEPTIEKPN